MMMPGRQYSAQSSYRYGFNGKENDNEVKGEGNEQDYGMRIYDPRLGRFLSVDPINKDYPFYTPYSFAGNKPIQYIDLDGGEENSPSTYRKPQPMLLNKVHSNGSNSTIGMNLGAIKTQKLTYENTPWVTLNPFQRTKTQTFANNVAVSGYNQAVESVEFSFNYLTSNRYRKQVEATATKKIMDFILWLGHTNREEKIEDFTDYITDVDTWEDFGGSLLWGEATGNFASFKAFGRLPIIAPAGIEVSHVGRVGRRLLGLKDRKLNDLEIRFFGSAVKGAPNPNDLDVLLITRNTHLFESGGRIDKILESIRSDFKKSTGKDLDINIMTPDEFRRAKGGEFKADVDKNSIKLN
jgi:RHS repeat-associated protein